MTTPGIEYFKALADETRLRILLMLLNQELNVNELVSALEMGQSRVSRHLKNSHRCRAASGTARWAVEFLQRTD